MQRTSMSALVTSILVTSTCLSSPTLAQSTRGNMGGGFIEMMFGDGEPYAAPARGPMYRGARRSTIFAPDYADPVQPAPSYEMQGQVPVRRMPVYGAGQVDPDMAAARAREMDPRYLPQPVSYDGREGPGTIIVDTPNRFLYLVEGGGRAMRYGIGVGRPGFTWAGVKTVSAKREWPDWRPPAEMLKRRPDLPAFMAGGPENPLGARAMYLGSSLYRIHGSNEPWTIGTSVSSGCIRMRNEDVIDLYNRVRVGTKVVVI